MIGQNTSRNLRIGPNIGKLRRFSAERVLPLQFEQHGDFIEHSGDVGFVHGRFPPPYVVEGREVPRETQEFTAQRSGFQQVVNNRTTHGRDLMRLTPAQIGMYSLLGLALPFGMPKNWTVADRIKHGREFLVQIAKVDFEFDAAKWHEHLRKTNAGGYRWSNKHLRMPKRIASAVADPEWCAAVDELRKIA